MRKTGIKSTIAAGAGCALLALLATPPAAAAPTLAEALAGGKPSLDLRLRYEGVEQDNTLRDADAITLRTRLGYSSAAWYDLTAFVEMEHVAALRDDYAPEQAGYSVVSDPSGAEVNQYGLRYAGVPGVTATLGRSRLILDNARWVGNVGWRQNEQTFDGAFLKYNGIDTLTGQYAYLGTVNTITATNADVDGHLLHLAWAPLPALTLSAYAYLLDYAAGTETDSDTFGLRAAGSVALNPSFKLLYAAEYARQNATLGTSDFDADYLHAELGLGLRPLTLKLGYERLGSDGGAYGLQTPLATKHAFQGWADVFLSTPANGVEDLYASVSGTLGPVQLTAAYHVFGADAATPADDYGSEIDLSAGMALVGKLRGLLKVADYSADDFGVDTRKLWLQFEYAI